jgi:Mg-chelatase subunit ChlD
MTILPNPFPKNDPKVATPGNKGALIVVVLDKSSSMGPYTDQTLKGLNSFLKEQRTDDAKFTLVQFNTATEFTFENRPANLVYDLSRDDYKPYGGTALRDAFGLAMDRTDSYLNGLPQAERPAVIFVVMTDGEENSSNTYSQEQIKRMVSARTEANWAFTFLGANIDAFHAGSTLGFASSQTAQFNQHNTADAYLSVSAMTTRMRSASVEGVAMATCGYTVSERTAMKGEND